VGGIELAACLEAAKHNGRARRHQQKAEHHAQRKPEAERSRGHEGGEPGERDLKRAADENWPPKLAQSFEWHLEADAEEQQHDANLGQRFDPGGVGYELKGVRPDEGTSHDQAGDRWQPEPRQQQDDQYRRSEDHHQIMEDRRVLHHIQLRQLSREPSDAIVRFPERAAQAPRPRAIAARAT
jgi:hypothetical protein